MKILYRQISSDNGKKHNGMQFLKCGINNCYFKHIAQENADMSNTKKRHSHTGFEFHLMINGSQTYESEEGLYCLKKGEFLMIPPAKAHKFISAEYPVEKYAITFSYNPQRGLPVESECGCSCYKGNISDRTADRMRLIEEEIAKYLPHSDTLIENAVFEICVHLMRECCRAEWLERWRKPDYKEQSDERVVLAKRFIDDNIEEPLQIREVAEYCYLSDKQLTRLFENNEGMTIATYIRNEKIKHIEKMLADPGLTLLEISETMGFPNESGFNSFFKKYNGMPPGEYRKMITSGKA